MCARSKVPSWFDPNEYAATHDLDPSGWARMLWSRGEYLEYSEGPADRNREGDQKRKTRVLRFKDSGWGQLTEASAVWGAYFADTRLSNVVLPEGSTLPTDFGLPRIPALEEVTQTAIRGGAELRAMISYDVGLSGKRLLLIDPSTPDDTLTGEFATWLASVRKTRPRSFKQRGPASSAKGRISESILRTWSAHQVLAVLDLDAYASLFEGKLTHAELCDVVNPKFPGDPHEWGKAAREKAREALAAVDALVAQVQAGMK